MRVLKIGFYGNLAVFIFQIAGGLWSGSWALIADAVHVLTDAAALAIALWAEWFSSAHSREHPYARKYTSIRYATARAKAKALAGVVNVVMLSTVVMILIVPAAMVRLFSPRQVLSFEMLTVALIGLAWNWWLRTRLKSEEHEYHIRSAKLHVDLDFWSSVGVVAAALLIKATGVQQFDPAASLLVSSLILIGGWKTFWSSVNQLINKKP